MVPAPPPTTYATPAASTATSFPAPSRSFQPVVQSRYQICPLAFTTQGCPAGSTAMATPPPSYALQAPFSHRWGSPLGSSTHTLPSAPMPTSIACPGMGVHPVPFHLKIPLDAFTTQAAPSGPTAIREPPPATCVQAAPSRRKIDRPLAPITQTDPLAPTPTSVAPPGSCSHVGVWASAGSTDPTSSSA